MDIKYLGHSSFYIKSKDGRLVTDPYDATTGLKFPKTEADIVTVSHGHPDHSNLSGVTGDVLVVDSPGEFEKKEIRIFGFQSYHDTKKGAERGENIIFKFEIEGMSILHCGDLGYVPEDSFIEEIGEVDVLLVPTGGVYTIDAEQAVELVRKIEPSVIIPMHYNTTGLNQKTFGSLSSVSDFLKKIGKDGTVPVAKLTLKKEDLAEEMKVVVMNIST